MQRFKPSLLALCGVFFLLLCQTPARAEDVDGEIAYLIDFIRHSPCTFIRNGTEYAGPTAADHVQAKYDYYKSDIHSVDDFITLSATKSMLSGKPYQVRCPDASAGPAAEWLRNEFKAYKARTGATGDSSN